jgi:hypothetical protein
MQRGGIGGLLVSCEKMRQYSTSLIADWRV